ncbi:MucR family transcriptional regulator [Enterovirga aerilata]|uniref:MucR family transcriptional regulator n=1 Tax=Enterovirga aerilata TaxID=2730920 RepID=A0A849I8E8_9HYPH|nr:MucR family transcriptional regulator [Enterovirga sp. DB1703]NNM73601.1 MucR family transcriptional regulator [Enterovirga sp. DB1703]
MSNTEAASELNFVELTAGVVAAYVAHNAVQKNDIPTLIASVHASLVGLSRPAAPVQAERPVPPVPIKKSIGDDYIISMEDGRRYKSLKRHLSGRGLTPEQYREKWGLPIDYPMVAPSYARQRSELAKSMGLGRQRRRPEAGESRAGGRRRKGA